MTERPRPTLLDELAAAVVITMTTTPDRLERFQQGWADVGAPLPLEVHTTESAADPYVGCWLAHCDVMRAHRRTPVVIFEDDAVFAPDFTLALSPPAAPRWDLFYFGGHHFLKPLDVGRPGLVRATRIMTNHAYAVREPGRLAEHIGPPLHQQIDGRLADLQRYASAAGHGGGVAPMVSARSLVCYAASPFTVGQDAGQSTISVNRNRPEPEFWNRKTFPDYGWV